ncbi:MAG TPA: ATP-binding protein [Thermoanaerobaculaceae bacterium]|nr:ATP-binding protein [Thermoanaerobaculaceae bacterium]
MSGGLPSRRFREAQLLIGATLLMLVGMVMAEMVGVFVVTHLVEEEARRAALAGTQLLANQVAGGEAARFGAALRAEGWGLTILREGKIVDRVGVAAPDTPAWWPWGSREEWERRGEPVAGPVATAAGSVLVAYQPLADGRVVRAVVPVSGAGAVGRWRSVGAVLAFGVALGGGLVAWGLIARVLAPYRELLAEAIRVTGEPRGEAEDRFLVDTFRDTVRRLEESEAALRRRADELEVLAGVLTRGSSAGVVITEPGGGVRAANPAAREIVPSLTVGRPIPPVLAGGAGEAHLGGRAVEIRRLPLLAATGEEQGEVVFLADRTGLESLERALAEREQMAALGELAAGMAHELRNALATMRGYARLLPGGTPEESARFVAAINEEAEGLADLLERFLRFAQPRDLRREPVDLMDLVNETAAKVRAAFPGVPVTVTGAPAVVVGDALALAVVVENLLRNGVEAVSPIGGSVAIRVEETPVAARVVVEDNGRGVPDEVRERIFLPFFSSKPSGGLGLALARRFARLHGGDVEHEPREGGGARFVVWLPRQGVA